MTRLILVLLACVCLGIGCAGPARPGSYYVTAPAVEVRLGPDRQSKATNRLYRQNRVDVVEIRNGWARISKYYDGRAEGVPGNVARWVLTQHLSAERPSDLSQPKVPHDPRISGLPKVGQGGLTEADVVILHRGAKHFLDSGRCRLVEYGDKSTSKPGVYYLNFGGPRNRFFKADDIPDLESRIRKLRTHPARE